MILNIINLLSSVIKITSFESINSNGHQVFIKTFNFCSLSLLQLFPFQLICQLFCLSFSIRSHCHHHEHFHFNNQHLKSLVCITYWTTYKTDYTSSLPYTSQLSQYISLVYTRVQTLRLIVNSFQSSNSTLLIHQ